MPETPAIETKALVVDDELAERSSITLTLEDAFHDVYEGCSVEVEAVDFEDATKLIRQDPNAFDLVVVDIIEKREGKPDSTPGIGLIDKLGKKSDAVIIAISEKSEELAKAKGAHAAVLKQQLRDGAGHMEEQLQRAFEMAGRTPRLAHPVKLIWDEESFALAATVELIGEERLGWLMSRLCQHKPTEIDVGFVRAGLSGAHVVHCFCHVADELDQEFLLKISRDGDASRQELTAWREISTSTLFPPLAADRVEQIDGWNAIAIVYQNGMTLTEWLSAEKPPSDDRVVSELKHLLLDGGLSTQYKRSHKPREKERPSEVMLKETLNLGRAARVLTAKDQVLELVDLFVPGADSAAVGEVVERFIRNGNLPNRGKETLPPGSVVVRVHGDLHGRNIVVGKEQQSVLIDPSEKVDAHPAMDWARLLVDVVLMGFASSPESHGWERMQQWRDLVAGLVRGTEAPDGDLLPHAAALAANWLRANTAVIFEKLGEQAPDEWELRLALAVELLRAVPRAEVLPMPVRVLALVAAVDALEAAAETAPQKGASG